MGCVCCCRNMCPASTWFATTTSTVTPSGRNSCHARKEIPVSVHCNTSSIRSTSLFQQHLLTLTALAGKAPARCDFTSKGCFGSGAESYSLLLQAGNQSWGGAHLVPRLSAQSSCKTHLPQRDQGAQSERCRSSHAALSLQHNSQGFPAHGVLNVEVIFTGIVQDLSQRPHFQSNLPWLLESPCVGQLLSITVLRIHLKCL